MEKLTKFLREVRAEMEKVSWPGRPEVQAATIVILVLVVLLSAFIGGVDLLIEWALGLFFRL